MTNLVYYRTCYNILGYDESLCNELGKSTDRQDIKDLEKKVQKSANIIVMVLEMPPALIPVLINVFAGAWSDRYGRKPVLLTVIAGTNFIIQSISTQFKKNFVYLLIF